MQDPGAGTHDPAAGTQDPAATAAAAGRLDDLQRLWTPWRMSYIKGEPGPAQGCPFCVLPSGAVGDDAAVHILHRGAHCFVILNAYPYNPGHLMVVPYRHVADLEALTASELAELASLTQHSVRALRASVGAHGFNLGMNLGGIAGAGIAEHLHGHVVPRWGGDTNFMPVTGATKVLPQLLEETYARLVDAFG